MRLREPPLPEPPDRYPYIRARVQGETYVLRVPSLQFATRFAQSIDPKRRAQLEVIAGRLDGGNALAALLAAPQVLDLVAAFVGLCWADPARQLESDQEAAIEEYGARVAEELHEAGWKLTHLAGAGLALGRELAAGLELDAEVREQAAFFLERRARSTASGSRSSATSSAPTEAEPSPS